MKCLFTYLNIGLMSQGLEPHDTCAVYTRILAPYLPEPSTYFHNLLSFIVIIVEIILNALTPATCLLVP